MARRLSAILAADVVGYSALMAADEAGTLSLLRAHRKELFDPKVKLHGGRIVKLMGDGALVEFPSVVDAVECALAIQQELAASGGPIRLRIGINLGDVIIDGDDIYGDGVNVAARLEALAEKGGICISSIVREAAGNRVNAPFVDAGAHEVKGISYPVRVWRWPAKAVAEPGAPPLALPDKPSVAVLPFESMSADPEHSFFAEGIAEDIITELSKFRSFFVIARNSSFAFKGQALKAREIGSRLGVRYIVEGSVRRSGNRIRITAQLIDAVDDTHLWAERFDREIADIFAVQDEVTHAIITTIEPALTDSERRRARRKLPQSLDAWESYQRGLWHIYQYNTENVDQGIDFMQQSAARDPNFASAHAGLALGLYMRCLLGASKDAAVDLDKGLAKGQRAISLDPSDPFAHVALGRIYTARGEHDRAIMHCERAIGLNPSFASAHFGRAHSLWMSGRPAAALPSHDEAIRLSPNDPILWAFMASRSMALSLLGRFEEALVWANRAMQQPNAAMHARIGALVALGHLGRKDEAAEPLAWLRRTVPGISVSFVREILRITDSDCRARYEAGLLAAGLPAA